MESKLEITFRNYVITKIEPHSLTAANILASSYFNFPLLVFLIKYLYHKENLDSDFLLGEDAKHSAASK